MILEVSRGHIKVKILDRVATVGGEMFFPGNDKLGFVVYSDTISFWSPPDQAIPISPTEKQLILDDIKADFAKGGHTLDIE
ncbi:Imm74 family immunity protein [Paraburkholderia sartisoli]|uniref:Immunity protein 74 n=1 Tax=Paraburkholderia sartisoli TaxID=83784 RepID=A0A1H4D5F6_9BURK|nr:Imm74 family immunity protein [Paraburkholderia sartisoli]SEA67766.1 Immunity protein 74 [Paraburkholderia sartisoli]